MMRVQGRGAWIAIVLLTVVGIALVTVGVARGRRASRTARTGPNRAELSRQALFAELQPVTLANCELERFGEPHDGGYLLCRNLLDSVQASYSYGISGYDKWGCDVSTRLRIPVHEYDCFNLTRPVCRTGTPVFHGECIGDSQRVEDGRPFDTLENQVRTNGDAGKRLVVKMDVEGAEWDAFLGASEDILQQIDQMAVEFHGFHEIRFIPAIWKLKHYFHIASLHWNNFACAFGEMPFPSSAYEVLFVNKRLAVADAGKPATPSLLHRPNNPAWRDCQTWAPR
jgi:hypothetical protein